MPIASHAEPSRSATTIGHGETPRSGERPVATHAPPEPLHHHLAQVAAEHEQRLRRFLAVAPLLAQRVDQRVRDLEARRAQVEHRIVLVARQLHRDRGVLRAFSGVAGYGARSSRLTSVGHPVALPELV